LRDGGWVQNTTSTVRTLRRVAVGAARHPEGLATLGGALLAIAALLALRREPIEARPSR